MGRTPADFFAKTCFHPSSSVPERHAQRSEHQLRLAVGGRCCFYNEVAPGNALSRKSVTRIGVEVGIIKGGKRTFGGYIYGIC